MNYRKLKKSLSDAVIGVCGAAALTACTRDTLDPAKQAFADCVSGSSISFSNKNYSFTNVDASNNAINFTLPFMPIGPFKDMKDVPRSTKGTANYDGSMKIEVLSTVIKVAPDGTASINGFPVGPSEPLDTMKTIVRTCQNGALANQR